MVFIFCFTVHLAKATSSHGLCDVEVSKIHPLFFYCLLSVLSTGVFLVYLRGSFVFSLLIVYLAVFLHSLDLYKYFTPLGNLLLGFWSSLKSSLCQSYCLLCQHDVSVQRHPQFFYFYFFWFLSFSAAASSSFHFPVVLLYEASYLCLHSISSHSPPSPFPIPSPLLAHLYEDSEDWVLGLLQLHHVAQLERTFSITARGLFLPSQSHMEIWILCSLPVDFYKTWRWSKWSFQMTVSWF